MGTAIVIGSSSGIGRALARMLQREGYTVAICARRVELLEELKAEAPDHYRVQALDVAQPEQARDTLSKLIESLGVVDLIVVSAGTGYPNETLDWPPEHETAMVNVIGFTAIVQAAMSYFLSRGRGHLVNISSIAALRGNGGCPSYNASKAYQSNYFEGLQQKVRKARLPIIITDIQPGPVDTAMLKGIPDRSIAASADVAADQIYTAIRRQRRHVYVVRRWRLLAWFLKWAPDWLCDRVL